MNDYNIETRILNLKEYNQSRLINVDIVSGKEYRRKLRKDKRKKVKSISRMCGFSL